MKKMQRTTENTNSNILVHGTFQLKTVVAGEVDIGSIVKMFCTDLASRIPEMQNSIIIDFEARARPVFMPGSKMSSIETKKLLVAVNPEHIYMDLDGTLFDFQKDEYLWRGKDIYLTPGEALFLLKRLVLKAPREAKERSVPSKLREKFGKDFLEGKL